MADGPLGARGACWQATRKQGPFLLSTANEVLFGGAAGGGKTDAAVIALLGLPDGMVRYPRYRAIVLRRKQKDLKAIADRAKELYPKLYPGTVFKGDYPLRAVFPSGAEVLFSGITKDFEDDVQGHDYQRALWEELCQQADPSNYLYLLSRLRCGWGDLPTRVYATANPIGPGRAWVRKRWRIEAEGGPSHFVARMRDGETGAVSRTERQFIPSRVSDNPHMSKAYIEQLLLLPKVQREALLRGRWDVKVGTFFDEFDPQCHVVPSFDIPSHWIRWRSLDWGFASPFCVLYHAMDPEGTIHTYQEFYGMQKTVDEVAAAMLAFEKEEQRRCPGLRYDISPADPSIWINQGRDRKEPSIGDAFLRAGVVWGKASDTDNSRMSGAMECRQRLRRRKAGLGFGAVVHASCRNWLRTVPELLFDKASIEDVDTTMEDHAYDAWRYGLMRKRIPPDAPVVRPQLALPVGMDW